MGSLSYAGSAYNSAAGTRNAFGTLSDELVAEGHPAMKVLDGDREEQDQLDIWYQRMTLTPGNRKVYGTAWWQGQRWYRIHPDTVGVPGSSNHEKRRANDLGFPYNSNTAAHRRAQELAKKHNITCEGMGFREWWHWTFWGALGVIGTPADSGSTASPTTDPRPLRRRQEEDGMYIKGKSYADVYKLDSVWNETYRKGQALLRLCGGAEASYAITGGLVVEGYDSTLTQLASDTAFGHPMPMAKRDGLEVVVIIDGDARTYALAGPGYWDDTEGMSPSAEVDLANSWARIYGNARSITYQEWNDLKRVGTGGRG